MLTQVPYSSALRLNWLPYEVDPQHVRLLSVKRFLSWNAFLCDRDKDDVKIRLKAKACKMAGFRVRYFDYRSTQPMSALGQKQTSGC